jgi:DNA transformation protein and related proteins
VNGPKLRNIGPKSAAWLRQVGLRSREDLEAVGAVDAYMRVKRAGFKPSLNLLYALEGALLDCHWQEVPDARRSELVLAAEAATALLPPPRNRPAAAPVTTTQMSHDSDERVPSFGLFEDERGSAASGDD